MLKAKKWFRGNLDIVQRFAIVAVFGILGTILVNLSMASSPSPNVEAEDGTASGCIKSLDDTSASAQKTVRFGASYGCAELAGAKLPIDYDLSSLSGTKRYVDDSGSDSTGNGSTGQPFASITKAYNISADGDYIIVRDGNYNEAGITINSNKSINIIAYPGETPKFSGSQKLSSGWEVEGSYSYHNYTPQPATNGSGISFTTGQALNGDGVGKYPDQVWAGSTQLRQVTQKTSLTNDTFWVDTQNNRLYLTTTRVSSGSIEASDKDTFATVYAPDTSIQGLRISRYSNSANDYGVIKFMASADNSLLKNVDISDSAFISVAVLGDSHINTGSVLSDVTISNSNWMGVSALYTEGFAMRSVKITGMNQFDEFTLGIQSGALKTSRTRNTKVSNSYIANNNGPGLWFDQSNLTVEVANNQIVNNTNSGVFYEISDDLLLINNYITASGSARAVKAAGSSGLKFVNNTIIGGSDVVGIYVDERSQPGCSDPTKPLCGNSYESDRDTIRPLPPTMTWIPAIDLMINNIIANPTGQGYCGSITALCITNTNTGTNVALEKVIHKANPALGIPQTIMDNNIYSNGSANIVVTIQNGYKTATSFAQALSGAPVSIPGLEQNSKSGTSWIDSTGGYTDTLTASHTQATAVPSNSAINQYLPAGYKHYGVSIR